MTSTTTTPKGPPGFDEIRFRWADVIPREAAWDKLSPQASAAFLGDLKSTVTPGSKTKPLTNADRVVGWVRQELLAGGFIELTILDASKLTPRMFVPDAVIPFSNRVRDLNRFCLLRPEGKTKLAVYCNNSFDTMVLARHVDVILKQAKITRPWYVSDNCFDWSIRKARWSDLVLSYLDNPLAKQVVDALWAAEKPLTYAEIFAKFDKVDPAIVRQTVVQLRRCLALFEDLEPETGSIIVGLLPEVRHDRAKLILASTDFELKPSSVTVQEVSPAGLLIDDLRALLVEIAIEPPKLKDNGSPYKKDEDRLLGVLPVRPFALETHSRSLESRLSSTIELARKLKFCDTLNDSTSERLALAKRGEEWMGGSPADAYLALFKQFQVKPNKTDRSPFSNYGNPEEAFFGCDLRVAPRKEMRSPRDSWLPDPKDVIKLQPFLWKFFSQLTPDAFYPLETLQRKFCFLKSCPLLAGLAIGDIEFYFRHFNYRDVEGEVPARAADFFITHLINRLLALGCVKVGVDKEGKLHFARTILLDAYYGKHTLADQDLHDPNMGTKVVVQPDYSIVVIGMNPGPVAQLATFCERVRGSLADGSVTLRITRDSVVKAVQRGTKPEAILERLKKLSSNPIPKNVEHEINEWGNWIRAVDVAPLLVIRCPDRDAADRVMSSLRQKAERLSEKAIALDVDSLSTKQIADLKKHGVIVKAREIGKDDDDDYDDDWAREFAIVSEPRTQ
ncbi:MAG: hypothetical protein EXS16_08275 [Gemmataceae bacterium]|nr:hypothetical protein [Gemmataceae bacterium]